MLPRQVDPKHTVPLASGSICSTDGHPRSSWTRHALHHDGEDDSMFDESATYEKARARSTITAHPGPNTWAARTLRAKVQPGRYLLPTCTSAGAAARPLLPRRVLRPRRARLRQRPLRARLHGARSRCAARLNILHFVRCLGAFANGLCARGFMGTFSVRRTT